MVPLLATFCLLALIPAHAAGLALVRPPDHPARRTLHVEPSNFSDIVVYETSTERCLTFTWVDNPDAETCYLRAHPDQVAFDYTRMMVSALLVQPTPQRILVIGAGGGTLARTFAALLPGAVIDAVEIDPAVIRVARKYFDFQASDRLRIHVADGRAFIEQALQQGDRYDLVMLDAFDDVYIPPHLITREFLLMVRGVLAEGGALAANTAAASGLSERERATYASVFGDVLEFPARNRIIMATREKLPSHDALTSNAQRWRPRLDTHGIDTAIFFQRLKRVSAELLRDAGGRSEWLTDANVQHALSALRSRNGTPSSP